jgi:hypothetical protein
MQHSFPKQAFLDDLLARNKANLELVQETFAPLDRAARSAQPEPGEWCVDQCLQHLALSFEMHLTHILPVLERDRSRDAAETFTRSWLARRNFYQKAFNPRTKTKTMDAVNPSDHYYPDVYTQYAAQKKRAATLLERASQNNLQKSCWFLRMVPINLGDYLELLVRHDELHIDQAQRALAAYRQFATT